MGFLNIRGGMGCMNVIMSILFFLLCGGSPFTAWRWNMSIAGYGWNRSWSLFTVVGWKPVGHMDAFYGACERSSELMKYSAMLCRTGLCLFYRDKCNAYQQLAYVSYGVAAVIMFNALWAFVCVFLALRGTSYTMKISSALWGFIMFFNCVAIGCYQMFMEDGFEQLNKHSIYPIPAISNGMFLIGFSCVVGGLVSCFSVECRNAKSSVIVTDPLASSSKILNIQRISASVISEGPIFMSYRTASRTSSNERSPLRSRSYFANRARQSTFPDVFI